MRAPQLACVMRETAPRADQMHVSAMIGESVDAIL